MTTQLAPLPLFRGWDNNGNQLVGGQLFTYQAGTTTPQATYVDSTQTTQNTNPVILNARGEANIWLDPTKLYKLVLEDSAGNFIWSQDQIVGGYVPVSQLAQYVTQGFIGQQLYPRTAAEIAVSAVPVNFQFPTGYPERYATNTTPGTTDMTAAVQAAINVARVTGNPVYLGTSGSYLVTSTLDCTSPTGSTNQGWRMIGVGNTYPQPSVPFLGMIHARHTGYAIFDCSGTFRISWEYLSVTSDSVTFPKTCWFFARNSVGSSMYPALTNTFVVGYFSVAILYNYGAEDGDYLANRWYNYSTVAGACTVVITANNFFKGSSAFISSSFITSFTGAVSSIGHHFFGGEYALANTSTTGDVFYLEGTVQNFKFNGGWMMNTASTGGGPNGRSFVYNDTTNGNCNFCSIYALKTENSATLPVNGIFFGTTAATPTFFCLRDSYINVTTFAVAASAAVTGADFTIQGVAELNSRGISWPGQLQDSFVDWLTNITIGTSLRNFIRNFNTTTTITTNTNSAIIDSLTGSIYAKTSLGMAGATGATQLTGWGTPTAGSITSNFPGTGATLAQCGGAITEIILQLKALGLFGA